jgi:hypothetical protein
MKRVTDNISKSHPLHWIFLTTFRDTLFEKDERDWKKMNDVYLEQYGKTAEEMLAENPDKVFKSLRRTIPQKDKLLPRMKELYAEFCKDIYQFDGIPLLNAEARKQFQALYKHIESGCLSDPPLHKLYVDTGRKSKEGLPIYRCIRGTSHIESFHQHIEMRFQPWNAGPKHVDLVLLLIMHRFNIRASERNRPNFPVLGHYDHFLIDLIQEITQELFGNSVHQNWWERTTAGIMSEESFGITSQLHFCPGQNPPTDEDLSGKEYTPSLQHLCKRTQLLIPFMPVHTREERALFKAAVYNYIGKSVHEGGGASSEPDFELMANDWNKGEVCTPTRMHLVALLLTSHKAFN